MHQGLEFSTACTWRRGWHCSRQIEALEVQAERLEDGRAHIGNCGHCLICPSRQVGAIKTKFSIQNEPAVAHSQSFATTCPRGTCAVFCKRRHSVNCVTCEEAWHGAVRSGHAADISKGSKLRMTTHGDAAAMQGFSLCCGAVAGGGIWRSCCCGTASTPALHQQAGKEEGGWRMQLPVTCTGAAASHACNRRIKRGRIRDYVFSLLNSSDGRSC